MTRLPWLLALPFLPAIAAAQDTAFDAPEPLGTVYVVCVALAFVAVLVAFCLYYKRWDDEENKEP